MASTTIELYGRDKAGRDVVLQVAICRVGAAPATDGDAAQAAATAAGTAVMGEVTFTRFLETPKGE